MYHLVENTKIDTDRLAFASACTAFAAIPTKVNAEEGVSMPKQWRFQELLLGEFEL